jgi:Fur family ferric uptake transcriptional regulator
MKKNKALSELRGRGLKATTARIAVLSAIAATEGYFTPQQLHKLMIHKGDKIGLVTVYRSLSALKNAGLVCQIENNSNSHTYVRRTGAHHHHLVCRSCARVIEFDGCELESLTRKLAAKTGFVIQGHTLELQGFCRSCAGLK